MKILIVDDSRAVHAYIKSLLADRDVAFFSAFDGEQGLAMIKENSFDLVLLDVEMPKMTGRDVLEKVRKFDASLAIIMVTSRNRPSEIGQFIELGANEYIMKPFTGDILIEKIEETLESEIV